MGAGQEAYEALDPPILVLLACLIPISDAVGRTGGAELIAGGLAAVAGALPSVGAAALVLVAAMIVRMGLLTRKPGVTTEQFRRHRCEVHGPLAARMPGLRRYHQNHVVDAAP
jgi:hypothetical protein